MKDRKMTFIEKRDKLLSAFLDMDIMFLAQILDEHFNYYDDNSEDAIRQNVEGWLNFVGEETIDKLYKEYIY